MLCGPRQRKPHTDKTQCFNMHVAMLHSFTILIQASPGVSENMAKVAVQRQALQQLLHHCTAQLLASQTCPVLVRLIIYLEARQTCRQYFGLLHPLWRRNGCVCASPATLFSSVCSGDKCCAAVSQTRGWLQVLRQGLPAWVICQCSCCTLTPPV